MKKLKYFIRTLFNTDNTSYCLGYLESTDLKPLSYIFQRMRKKHPDLEPEVIERVASAYKETLTELISEGVHLETIEGIIDYYIKGRFKSIYDVFQPSRHRIVLKCIPHNCFKEATKKIQLQKMRAKELGPNILTIRDNQHKDLPQDVIYRGGYIYVYGKGLKIVGNGRGSTDQGVYITTRLGKRSKLSTVIYSTDTTLIVALPPDYVAGKYGLEIWTYWRGREVTQILSRGISPKEFEVIEPSTTEANPPTSGVSNT